MNIYRFKRVTHDALRKFLPDIGFECTPADADIFYSIGRGMRYCLTSDGIRYDERRRDGTWERVRWALLKDLTFVRGQLKGLKIGGMDG